MDTAIRYRIFKLLEVNPELTQRELAQELGVSLGKANYCLKALINKGSIKVENFRRSKSKINYLYKLTPQGIEEKARVTRRFLQRKMEEYELIQAEIEQLQREVEQFQHPKSSFVDSVDRKK